VLGERIERRLYDLLETLLRAKYTRQRATLLDEANMILGYRVFPTHRLLVKDNVRRFRRRVRQVQRQYAAREISPDDVRRRLMSWSGHAKQANTYRLRCKLFGRLSFQRATADKPCFAGRLVQQPTTQRAVRQP
jgi:hypothetical protein